MSSRFTPQASTRTSACPGPGVGRRHAPSRSTSRSPVVSNTTARICSSVMCASPQKGNVWPQSLASSCPQYISSRNTGNIARSHPGTLTSDLHPVAGEDQRGLGSRSGTFSAVFAQLSRADELRDLATSQQATSSLAEVDVTQRRNDDDGDDVTTARPAAV